MALTRTARNVSALPGAIVNDFVAAEELELGEVFYINSSDQGALAQANAAATAKGWGIVTSVNDPGGGIVVPAGKTFSGCVFGPVAGFTDMSEGDLVWVSAATAGVVTQTQPSGAGTWSRGIGYALEVNKLFVMPGITNPPSNS